MSETHPTANEQADKAVPAAAPPEPEKAAVTVTQPATPAEPGADTVKPEAEPKAEVPGRYRNSDIGVKAEPKAEVPATEFPITLHEACVRLSQEKNQVEMLAAFSHEMRHGKDGLLKGTFADFKARFETFHQRPVVSEPSSRPVRRPNYRKPRSAEK